MRETAYRQMIKPPQSIAALPLKHQRALRDALRAASALEDGGPAGEPAAAPAAHG